MIDEQKRPLNDRLRDADNLLKRHDRRKRIKREEAIKYVEDVRALTDATSGRPSSYFLDEGCSPEDVVEHFRNLAVKQKERLIAVQKAKEIERAAEEDAERRWRADPKNAEDVRQGRRRG